MSSRGLKSHFYKWPCSQASVAQETSWRQCIKKNNGVHDIIKDITHLFEAVWQLLHKAMTIGGMNSRCLGPLFPDFRPLCPVPICIWYCFSCGMRFYRHESPNPARVAKRRGRDLVHTARKTIPCAFSRHVTITSDWIQTLSNVIIIN